jgi:subtilisin family serine protease
LALLGLVVTTAGVAPASAQVRFRSGPYWAQVKTPEEIRGSITALAARPNQQHVLVRFDQPLSSPQRGLLEQSGLGLLSHLGDHAFFASLVRGRVNADALSAVPGVTEVTAIDPVWKVHPAITQGQMPTYAVVDNSDPENPVVAVYVMFHRDVDLAVTGTNTTSKHGGVALDQIESVNTLVVELPWARLNALANEDVVQWIEWPLAPLDEINDSARAITEVDIVQAPPYGLNGTGVTALIYDGGQARATHVDFEGRLVVGAGDTSGLSDHSTHVACTVGGAGVANATYAGMAPAVDLVSYGFEYDGTGIFLYSNPGDIESDYTAAINTYGADIANNSIGTNTETNGFDCAIQGDYGVTSALIDAIVGGSMMEE